MGFSFFLGGDDFLPLNLSVKYLRLKPRDLKPLALSLPEIHLPGDAQDSCVTADEDHSLAGPPEWSRRSYKTVKALENIRSSLHHRKGEVSKPNQGSLKFQEMSNHVAKEHSCLWL